MKRGKSFTWDQDVAICNARLKILQDPLNVVSQPQHKFWDRICQKYVELTGDQDVRSQQSVRSRWKMIFRGCKTFHYCLTQIEDEQSGLTESDKVHQANMLYFQLEKKSFSMNHCWAVLQHKLKWTDLKPGKRSNPHAMATDHNIHSSPKRSNPQTTATNPNVNSSLKRFDPQTTATNLNIDSSPKRFDPRTMASSSSQSQESNTLVSVETDKDPYYTAEFQKNRRPTRRRAEKEACKRSKVADTLDSRFCDLMEKLTKQLAETDERKAKVAERKVKVMEQMNEREQREHDDRIMSMDTSKMEPRAREYYEQRKNDVYFKTMACTKGTSDMDPHSRTHYDHDDIMRK